MSSGVRRNSSWAGSVPNWTAHVLPAEMASSDHNIKHTSNKLLFKVNNTETVVWVIY